MPFVAALLYPSLFILDHFRGIVMIFVAERFACFEGVPINETLLVACVPARAQCM
jgi:hypothetical protein